MGEAADVERDRDPGFLGPTPQRVVVVVAVAAAGGGVAGDDDAPEAEVEDPIELGHRLVGVLHGEHGKTVQPPRRGCALLVEPVVVVALQRDQELGVRVAEHGEVAGYSTSAAMTVDILVVGPERAVGEPRGASPRSRR